MAKRRYKIPLTVIFVKNGLENQHRYEEEVDSKTPENEMEHVARRQALQRYLDRGFQVKKIVIEHAGA